jgi:UDP-N-acetylmuramyl pentapeptide phosphotransferase/UDP-N-acetylglucosamine-1-phosphate transferase
LLLLAGFGGLAAISWRDDRKSLPVAVRLVAQIAAVLLGLAALPQPALFFQGYLPPIADHLVAAIAWIWFINLYNFMDGIDGISGAETASIGIGLVLVVMATGLATPIVGLGAALAGAACGFLLWNWTPARLFLGDVGSIPLGFLAGFALLYLAANGHIVAAMILPLYYLLDATLTLLRRLARGEPIWRAHRSHAYQIAAAATSHPAVVLRIVGLNVFLIGLALGVAVFAGNTTVVAGGLALALAAAGTLVARFRAARAAG